MNIVKPSIITLLSFPVLLTGCITTQSGGITREVKAAVREAVDSGNRTGIVIGQIRRGKTSIFGYGTTAAENGRIPDGETVFALGSVTKIFTAETLAALTRNLIVTPATTLGEIWPRVLDGNPVTLGALATHTAGLPRDLPLDLLASNREALLLELVDQAMGNSTSQASQAAPRAYSNVGMAVLGLALQTASGLDQETLTGRYITSPLGMTRSSYTGVSDSNSAQPHRDGIETTASRHATPSVAFGSGGLHSTARDLLIFLEAHLNPAGTPMESNIWITEEGWKGHPLGWQVHGHGRGTIFYHSGDGDGYQAFIGYRRDRKAAVVLLANSSADDELQRIALHILDPSVSLPSFADIHEPVLPDRALETYTGTYRLASEGPEGNLIFIENQRGRLVYKETTSTGSLVRLSPMIHQGKHRFLVVGLPLTILFPESPEERASMQFQDTDYPLVRVD